MCACFEKGAKIPTEYANQRDVIAQRLYGDRGYTGHWRPGMKDRYLGLTFYLNGEKHYGWARLSIPPPHHPPQIGAVLTGYAYETIPNKTIIAGKTEGPDVVTTQPDTAPTTLGGLALGRR